MGSSYLFNAKESDEETGLYYYGARYLNPSIALWLSTDPLQGKYPGISPYNYCAGNPVKLVDPDGEAPVALALATQPEVYPVIAIVGIGYLLYKSGEYFYEYYQKSNASINEHTKKSSDTESQKTGNNRTNENDNVKKGKSKTGDYSNIPDSKKVGEGGKFTSSQKKKILEENRKRNGGELRSDKSGKRLDSPTQSHKGEKANMNQAEIDHKIPKSKGGSNSFGNAQVLSKEENLMKSNK